MELRAGDDALLGFPVQVDALMMRGLCHVDQRRKPQQRVPEVAARLLADAVVRKVRLPVPVVDNLLVRAVRRTDGCRAGEVWLQGRPLGRLPVRLDVPGRPNSRSIRPQVVVRSFVFAQLHVQYDAAPCGPTVHEGKLIKAGALAHSRVLGLRPSFTCR